MNTITKKIALGLLCLIPAQYMCAMEVPAVATAQLTELIKNPQVQQFIVAMSAAKEVATDSIGTNFAQSGKGFVEGFHGLGLGLSRLALESSRNFRDVGVMLSKHYWMLGGLITGSALFYVYVLPKIRINASWSFGGNPPAHR